MMNKVEFIKWLKSQITFFPETRDTHAAIKIMGRTICKHFGRAPVVMVAELINQRNGLIYDTDEIIDMIYGIWIKLEEEDHITQTVRAAEKWIKENPEASLIDAFIAGRSENIQPNKNKG